MRVEFILGPETINNFNQEQKADLIALAVQARDEKNYLDYDHATMTINQVNPSDHSTCPTYVLNLILGE